RAAPRGGGGGGRSTGGFPSQLGPRPPPAGCSVSRPRSEAPPEPQLRTKEADQYWQRGESSGARSAGGSSSHYGGGQAEVSGLRRESRDRAIRQVQALSPRASSRGSSFCARELSATLWC
ncbi:Pax3- And Pax7-Binding Protein 1, partial [Manis pentadactyla]